MFFSPNYSSNWVIIYLSNSRNEKIMWLTAILDFEKVDLNFDESILMYDPKPDYVLD